MGLTVYGGGGKPEEEKTVTAGISAIEVLPSSGKVMKKVTVNPTPTESKSVTPTTSELTVTPSEGKHLSQVVVGAVEDVTPEVTAQTPLVTQILEGLVGKAQGANATADKILEGYSAYVGQELLQGTAKDLSKQVAVGTVIPTSDLSSLTVSHGLGVTPSFVGIYMDNNDTLGSNMVKAVFYPVKGNALYSYYKSSVHTDGGGSWDITSDSSEINFGGNGHYYISGKTYHWFALA